MTKTCHKKNVERRVINKVVYCMSDSSPFQLWDPALLSTAGLYVYLRFDWFMKGHLVEERREGDPAGSERCQRE